MTVAAAPLRSLLVARSAGAALAELGPVMLVLALACAVRLPFPDLTPFGHDEALEAARARPIWEGARPVDSEITSWWIPDPAGLLYVFALAEAFAHPAIARVELVGLLNVGAILVTYRYARGAFGPAVALAASLLYAANPWAATFSRQPWVITQPLLTAVMLLAATRVVVDRGGPWIIAFFVALAAQTQTHLLAVLYAPPVLATLLLFWRRWARRELFSAGMVAAAIVAPYGLHLLAIRQEVFEALERGNRGLTLAPMPAALEQTLWLASGYRIDAKLGLQSAWLEALRPFLFAAMVVSGALLALGIVRVCRDWWRRSPGWEAGALVLIWFAAPLTLMTWQSSAVYIHYLLVLLPTPFLLLGLGLRTLADAGGRAGGRIGLALLAGTLAIQILALAAFYRELDASLAAPPTGVSPTEWQARLNEIELRAKQEGIGELHGLPLRYWQSVADRTKAFASLAETADVVVLTGIQDEANRLLDKRRKAVEYLLGPQLQARFPLEGLVVVPTLRDTLFVTIPEQDLPRVLSSGARRLAELPLPGTSGVTRVWLVNARPVEALPRPRREAKAMFSTGIRLLGLDAPTRAQAGRTIPIASYWLVERELAPLEEDDEPFIELQASDGRPLSERRIGGLPSQQWRQGDLLIQRSSLTVPVGIAPGEYWLATGLASRRDGTRALLLGPAGLAGDDSVQVAMIRVTSGD